MILRAREVVPNITKYSQVLPNCIKLYQCKKTQPSLIRPGELDPPETPEGADQPVQVVLLLSYIV